MNPTASRFAVLMGTASLLTLTAASGARAQTQQVGQIQTAQSQQVAQAKTTQGQQAAQAQTAQGQQVAQAQKAQAAQEIPEQVLITGSLIHGTAAVGVPVTNLSAQDFVQTGAISVGELFRTIPAAIVSPGPSAVINGGQQERQTRVNLRGLDTTGPRSLLMVDGLRFPPQADGLCVIDPSIIPVLALDRIDVLADGASATYGSDAISGVINVVLKRGYEGATTLLHVQAPDSGGLELQASQLYGHTWDTGDVTVTYEWLDEKAVPGTAHSKYTLDYTPWGLDNANPIGVSLPGTISTGKPNGGVGCTNCYAIPHGTGANFNPGSNGYGPGIGNPAAPAFDWTTFATSANAGTNVLDALKLGDEQAAQQKNSFAGTFDQRLWQRDGFLPGASLFIDGFYTNRRVQFHNAPVYSNGATGAIKTVTIPTNNPYYPTNVPGNLYGKLQVSYDLAYEAPITNHAWEISDRYSFGVNLDLPFAWSGQLYDSRSYETNQYNLRLVNKAYVPLALGATATTFGGATFAKPDTVPYLNLFCDPTKFTCNSPVTLKYIQGLRHLGDIYNLEEKGGKFDGPLFDLPGGQVKAAVGGSYESDNVLGFQSNSGQSDPVPGSMGPTATTLYDPLPYNVWAAFGQLDVPIFGDNFNIPLFRKLDLEVSWRHDQYHGSLNGGTSNPKVGFTWLLDDTIGATVRGSWGTSFRFANAGEVSTILSDQNASVNVTGASDAATRVLCTGSTPPPGSAAADLYAAGFGCSAKPGGIEWGGGPRTALRVYMDPSGHVLTREGGGALQPEQSINYSVGLELAPTFHLLQGLDLQATYYSIKINGVLNPFNQITSSDLADPTTRFTFILPSDLGCPVSANANPTSCVAFEKMATAAITDFNSVIGLDQLPNIHFLRDGSTTNSGFYHVDGIDFSASYDYDAGDYGAWNTGITGTYYLHNYQQNTPTSPVIDLLHQNLPAIGNVAQNGVETSPRMAYRARLGWTNGPYSVTGFVNYISHYYSPWAVPPNVNNQCATAGGTTGGGTFPCAINNYSYELPSMYTFDLSLGYNTGDIPTNDYLKGITVQLTIQNIMGIHPAFAYGPVTSHRNAAGYDILKPDTGRIIGLTIKKEW